MTTRIDTREWMAPLLANPDYSPPVVKLLARHFTAGRGCTMTRAQMAEATGLGFSVVEKTLLRLAGDGFFGIEHPRGPVCHFRLGVSMQDSSNACIFITLEGSLQAALRERQTSVEVCRHSIPIDTARRQVAYAQAHGFLPPYICIYRDD